MIHADVIILGAGAAGLSAARVLAEAGRSVLIVEARDRIGGRISTLLDDDFEMPVELGAEFIHGRPQATFDLMRKAQLTPYDLPFEQHQRRGGRLRRISEDEMEPIMKQLRTLGEHDMSFAEFLRKQFSGRKFTSARQAAADFVEGFDAADLNRISAKSLAEEQEGLGDIEDEMQFRLLEGYAAIVRFLQQSLDRQRVRLDLETVAEEIAWSPGKVTIGCQRAGRPQAYTALRAIVTLPVGILKLSAGDRGSVQFTPELPTIKKAVSLLESGPVVKAVFKFREAFWESKATIKAANGDDDLKDASFLHHSSAAFPTWWTTRPLRLPILTGWAGGPKAAALAGRTPDELRATAIESLAQLFQLPTSRIKALAEKLHIYDWLSDPFSRGAYSYVAVGGGKARAMLAKPIKNTLFFAGEATDTSGQASTVAGALISGQRGSPGIAEVKLLRTSAGCYVVAPQRALIANV